MGIVEGVTGVATKPYQGARDDGVGGFFKGVGKVSRMRMIEKFLK